MSKQNALIGKITSISPSSEMRGIRPFPGTPQLKTVILEGDRKGLLDLSYPRASVWVKIIEYLRKNNRPVYVEIDPDTRIITALYVPQAANVLRIADQGGDVVYVFFSTSEARYYIRRNNPDFQDIRDALQNALNTQTTVQVTAANDFEIIDVRPLPPSFGENESPESPASNPPDPPVTWNRAVELFNQMKTQSCIPCAMEASCIPFKYPYDGCWIRAHMMCYLMQAQGETPEKIWISGNLHVLTANVPECEVYWGWHVAPTLLVKPNDGPAVKMVIDPSLFNRPVTLEEWKTVQGDPGADLTSSAWDRYNYGGGTATQVQADNDMELYRLRLNEECSAYGPPPYVCPLEKKCAFIVDRSNISKDEVDALLTIVNPANINSAFFVIVDGFTPSELGITDITLVGVPNIHPTLTLSPDVPQMAVEVMATIGLEDPDHLLRRQRITWKYRIRFTGNNAFAASDFQIVNLTASLSTVSANASIYLTTQPNPYEIDGEITWLSTDLRVFQIKTGDMRFNQTMSGDPNDFIAGVLHNLNSGATGGEGFEGISADPQLSRLELSQTVDGIPVYNYAIAKVRYRAKVQAAHNVRVFFRSFPASSTSLAYDPATNYRRSTQGTEVNALLGLSGGELMTIPFFAAPRIDSSAVSMSQQTDPVNVREIPADLNGNEVVRYFGCWLDINQTQPQFPIYPTPPDGPYAAVNRKTIQELIRNQHQCLVAEIAFDPAPILTGASPSLSDKLAQRNLAIVESANPGTIASRRIPHTFEFRPTGSELTPDEVPDELMIDWGNTPAGSLATIYLPGVDTNEVLELAMKLYRSHHVVRIDSHTLQCETGGIDYIPIPKGEGGNEVGMITIDLPETIRKGQAFTIIVRQVTTLTRAFIPREEVRLAAASRPRNQRRVLGSFQITIPVREKEEIVAREERLLANLRWIEREIPEHNRWFSVFTRYVKQVADRVDALGGNSKRAIPSPSDEWRQKPYLKCRILLFAIALTLIALIVSMMTLTGDPMLITVFTLSVILIGVIRSFINVCRPPF
ncbi:MAG: protein-glutamine glutaminase family protein [Candidatus Omnitrophota bacterium]